MFAACSVSDSSRGRADSTAMEWGSTGLSDGPTAFCGPHWIPGCACNNINETLNVNELIMSFIKHVIPCGSAGSLADRWL